MRKEKIMGKWRLLNPKYLQKEVDAYGYHFSWKSHMALVLCALLGIGALGMLFQLQTIGIAVVILAVFVTLPVLIVDMYRGMYEQRRFADVTAYMEQMLYSFQKNGKVVSALKECTEIFGDGQMRGVIIQAISHIEQGRPFSELGVLRESLQMIEQEYACEKLIMVHKLLVGAEEYGGEITDSVMFAIEDIEGWKKRGYRLQAEKKRGHMDNVISIVVAVALCAVALYVLDHMRTMFTVEVSVSLFRIPVIQVSSVLFLVLLLGIFIKSARNLTENWLSSTCVADDAYLKNCYAKVMEGTSQMGRCQRVVLLLTLAGMILAWVDGRRVGGVVCLILIVFLLTENRISYRIAKRDVTRQLYLRIPEWLMELALLLQNNNVQVAIAKSADGSPVVLREELQMLTMRIEKAPERLDAYTDFCCKFDIPEATSCMKMLHAFSENGSGNMQTQISRLVERVGQMQQVAEEIQNENIAFRMKIIFSYPVMAATMKLLVDLSVGMVVMMQVLGSIGGA